jgi:hypothetical protein
MLGSKSEAPELSRMIKARLLPADAVLIEADERERAALSERFGLVSIEELSASVELEQCQRGVRAEGSFTARITQTCAVAGEPFDTSISEPILLRFIETGTASLTPSEDEEVDFDLTAEDCDEIEYDGESFDLGEAVAQSLGLAIDPYAEGPRAAEARKAAGIVEEGQQDGPLADALRGLARE